MNLKEKFEILAKSSGWNGRLSSEFVLNCSSDSENENVSKLIDHVMLVLERREITCIELNTSFERQQLELEASKEHINLNSIRLKEMRDKLISSENYGIELNSRISSLTAQILSIEQNLKREKSQANWSAEELQNTLNAFSNFRKEQSVLVSEIRSQTEVANFQAQEAQQKLFRTSQSLKDREKQISELQEQVANLKADLSANEANFTREMNSNTRMVELYRNASEEAMERILILQNEIEELREVLSSLEAQESCSTADLEAELENRQEIIKSKDEQLEKMRIALDDLLKAAKVSQNDNDSDPFSITENISKRIADKYSNISVSDKQIYIEYVTCKGRLAKAEEECCQMRLSMQEMLNEINSRDSIKNENYRLQEDISALTEQLIEATEAREIISNDRMELERLLKSLRAEKDTLQQECDDLSQQVQRLLFEIENNSNSQKQDVSSKRHRTSADVLMASEIITENFVDLTSIAQLQQRNQELLRSLRGISAKYEALEKVKESPQLKVQLEAALTELDLMNEARKRQAQMVETILKTKTSNSIDNGSSIASKVAVSETLNMELEHLKKQLESRQESLKLTISELEASKKQLADERVSKARVSAQSIMNEERLKMIQETLQQERLEAVSVRERATAQMDSFNLAQSSIHKLMADLSNAQDRETRLHGQVEKLQNEISLLMIESARLQQETLSASVERDRVVGMVGSMQSLLSEHEASEATLKRHFTAQIEFMERELEASRARLSETSSSHNAALSAIERDRSELFKRLEILSEELSQRREINLRLEGNLAQAQEKINDLERVLNQAASESTHDEINVKTFELKNRALTAELKNQQVALQTANSCIIELEERVKELDELKLQLNSQKETLSVKDNNLQESLAEIEHLKGDKERLEDEINFLKESLQVSQNRVAQLSNQLEELRGQFSSKLTEISAAEDEINRLSSQLNDFKAQCLALDSELNVKNSEQKLLKVTIADVEGRLKDLQDQNEMLLDEAQKTASSGKIGSDEIDEGADLGVIRFLREEKDKLRVDRDRLLTEIRNFQSQAEEAKLALNSERLALSAQSADYARLLAEVERLNSVRESGAVQQQEFAQLKMKISMLETQLRGKNYELIPIKDSLEKIKSENEELKESESALRTDRDTWKIRFETAISAASDTSPIESELKQVKLQSEMFRQRAIALTKNLAETRTTAQREIKELQNEIEDLKSKIENSSVEHVDSSMMCVTRADVEMSHAEPVETETEMPVVINAPVPITISTSDPVKTPTNASVTVIETSSSQNFDNVKECDQVQSQSDENEDESEQEGEDADGDSIYKESEHSPALSESISEIVSVSVSESPVIELPVESIKETLSETVTPVIISAAPIVEQVLVSTPVPEQFQSQSIASEVPRKKIVSLSRIVGNSSVYNTNSLTSIAPSTPTMITTASGKKFVPVTFPDPPSVSSIPSQPNASTNFNLPGTPSKKKKKKKNLGKNNNSIINNNNMSD